MTSSTLPLRACPSESRSTIVIRRAAGSTLSRSLALLFAVIRILRSVLRQRLNLLALMEMLFLWSAQLLNFLQALEDPATGLKSIMQIGTRSKLSCLSWHKRQRHLLASSDYDGVVSLWDTNTAKRVVDYEEVREMASPGTPAGAGG